MKRIDLQNKVGFRSRLSVGKVLAPSQRLSQDNTFNRMSKTSVFLLNIYFFSK